MNKEQKKEKKELHEVKKKRSFSKKCRQLGIQYHTGTIILPRLTDTSWTQIDCKFGHALHQLLIFFSSVADPHQRIQDVKKSTNLVF